LLAAARFILKDFAHCPLSCPCFLWEVKVESTSEIQKDINKKKRSDHTTLRSFVAILFADSGSGHAKGLQIAFVGGMCQRRRIGFN
jgi:hypothetical protein